MIPVSEPLLGEREIEYATECIRTGWISSGGRFIEEFEHRWATYCGMKYGIAVSNGTVALQTAVACIGLKAGFQIIMPTFTIISCALAVIYNGGVPVLVDSDPRTWCMDVSQVEEKITDHTRAIMPVHIYGHPVDMDPLLELADRHGLSIIEDAAEAHGAEYLSHRGSEVSKWKRCGGMGHLSCFSFYANKVITTGEGGMVLTNDPVLAEKARSLRNLCFRPEKRFYHTELGNNFRLTNLQAALGLAQIGRIDEILTKKRWIGRAYTQRLKNIPGIRLPTEESWARQIYWMYGVALDESTGLDAAQFAQKLKEIGVETRPFFLGMHEQPVFQEMGLFRSEKLPVAERIARQGLYLPSGLTLKESDLERVTEAIKKVLL
jgi:perosamine synthetase